MSDSVRGLLRVGPLAKATGLSVRTLHYYDEIGLLSPERHTSAGHRLYGPEDVRRLQHIISLRQLGFSLEEIRDSLDRPDFSLDLTLARHIDRLDEQIDLQRSLRRRLAAILERLRATQHIATAEFIHSIEEAVMIEKYYTPEQREQLRVRAQEVGQERIQQVQLEWEELFARYREEMERGTDPASERVQALAAKSVSLIREFTDGDAGIAKSLANMYRGEGAQNVLGGHGYDVSGGLWEYMQKAAASLGEEMDTG